MCPYVGVRCTALHHSKMSACYSYSLHGRIAMLRLFCCVFAHEFLFNPQFDLETDYIIRKPLPRRIQRYILHRKILSTFHTRVNNRSMCHFCIVLNPKLPLSLRRSPLSGVEVASTLSTCLVSNSIQSVINVNRQVTELVLSCN